MATDWKDDAWPAPQTWTAAHISPPSLLTLADRTGARRAILIEYQVYYDTARPHQGIAQRVPSCDHEAPWVTATNLNAERINREPVLSGLINEYSRAA